MLGVGKTIALPTSPPCAEVWVFLCGDVLSRNMSQPDQLHGKREQFCALASHGGDSSWSPSDTVFSESCRRTMSLSPPQRSDTSPSLPAVLTALSRCSPRGHEPLAHQEAPQEDAQGAAQSCLHRGLAPGPGWLLHRSGWPEGLPPPHRAQQEGTAPTGVLEAWLHLPACLPPVLSPSSFAWWPLSPQLLRCFSRDLQSCFLCAFSCSLSKGHITGDASWLKTASSPPHLSPRGWESRQLRFFSVPRFTVLAMGSTWRMAKW